MISIKDIPDTEIVLSAIRSSGPGGQKVNKVATAVHLRFDICASSIPGHLKQALLALRDRRISSGKIIVIKSQTSRSQECNRVDALERLDQLLIKAQKFTKPRKKTRPTKASVRKRLDAKTLRGRKKNLRKPFRYL